MTPGVGSNGIANIFLAEDIQMTKDRLRGGWLFVGRRADGGILFIGRFVVLVLI